MTSCPKCNTTIPDNAETCPHCTATLKTEETSQANLQSISEMQVRLKKAMRRTELLTYAAAGLGVALLAIIIGIAFL
jgi:uncharacterized membrane protein YvbJ